MNAHTAIEQVTKCKEMNDKLIQLNNKIYKDEDFAKSLFSVGISKNNIDEIQSIIYRYKDVIENELKNTELKI